MPREDCPVNRLDNVDATAPARNVRLFNPISDDTSYTES